MSNISKNFTWEEMEYSKKAKENNIKNTIDTSDVRDSINALVKNILQPLRDAWGNTLKINSGYRCKELNEKIGGVPTSQHCKGEAADISSSKPIALARLAKDLNLPYDQMIIYPTFVHFSHKKIGIQRKQILYNKSYKGEKL